MKFDILEVIDPSAMEDGVWMHLASPIDGEPLYRDPDEKTLPCRAKVRSVDCKRIADFVRRDQATTSARAQRMRAAQRNTFAGEAARDRVRGMFALQLAALDNATSEQAGIVEVTQEAAFEMFENPAMQWIVEQVVNFSNSSGNFGREEEGERPTAAAGATAGGKGKATRST